MRFLKQDKESVASSSSTSSVDSVQSKESTTGTVLRRLDLAIQSLENDKRQLSNVPLQQPQQQQAVRIPPVRSNSLSAMSSYSKKANATGNHIPKTKIVPTATPTQQFSSKFMLELVEGIMLKYCIVDSRRLPTRSSSLKINSNAFDTPPKQSLSNMDDLELVSRNRISACIKKYMLIIYYLLLLGAEPNRVIPSKSTISSQE